MLHSASRVAGPAQRPRIHKVHGAAIAGSSSGVSPGEGVIIAMGAVAAAIAIAERDGTSITCPHYRQPPKDGGDGHNINNLLLRKSLALSRSSHLHRRFELDNEIIIRCYVTLCNILTHYYLG